MTKSWLSPSINEDFDGKLSKTSVTKLAENFKMSTESGGNDFWVNKKWGWGGEKISQEISLI